MNHHSALRKKPHPLHVGEYDHSEEENTGAAIGRYETWEVLEDCQLVCVAVENCS